MKIKSLIIGVFVGSMVLAFNFSSVTLAASATDHKNKAIYFVPHQDDEVLSMGASIASHAKAGREVHLVLVTDGSGSGAITKVNAKLKQEGRAPLTVAQFSKARNAEFEASAIKLGVKKQNLHYERLVDGKVTSQQAEKVIDKYIAAYKGASFKSMSWLDLHNDHYKLGYALNNRCVSGIVTDCRFYQSALYQKGSTHPNALSKPQNTVVSPKGGRYASATEIARAAAEYKVWNPAAGRYSVGYLSVASSFDHLLKNPSSYYHKNNANWRSVADRDAAKKWINTIQQASVAK